MCDWLGKTVSSLSQWPGPGKMTKVGLCVAVCTRVVFIPAIMACNVAPSNRSSRVELWMMLQVQQPSH